MTHFMNPHTGTDMDRAVAAMRARLVCGEPLDTVLAAVVRTFKVDRDELLVAYERAL